MCLPNTPYFIKKAREDYRLSQSEAAALIYKSCRAWQNYESGSRKMDKAYWELFIVKARNVGKVTAIDLRLRKASKGR